MRTLTTAILLVGCRGVIEPDQTRTWTNSGQICVASEADRDALEAGETPTTSLEADGDLVIVVTMAGCETCADGASTTCSVIETPDGVIIIDSSATYVVQDGSTCPEECTRLSATCEIQNIPPGTYTIEHGGDLLPIEVPSNGPAPCAGEIVDPEVGP